MFPELIGRIGTSVLTTVWGFLPTTIAFAVVFTALSLVSSQACNPGRTWWRNPGLITDICYMVVIPFVAPYLRLSLMVMGAGVLSGVMTNQEINDYFVHGLGPLGGLPFWGQVLAYVVISDFLLYWTHRIFHGATMWRFHAVHHSAEEIDWTTAYRFHPVNMWLGASLVTVFMLFLGVSPTVLLFLVPFDTTTAAFVHANLNWTLGPLKYVVATPVFHRWHHTPLDQGGNTNFAPLLSVWDVLFGTFSMPEHKLPSHYGIDEPAYPQGFIGQLVHPFRTMVVQVPPPGTIVVQAPPRGEATSRPPAP